MFANIKVLIPWYRFPPFSQNNVGGLSVSIWDLSRNLAKNGINVVVLTPPQMSSDAVKENNSSLDIIDSSLGAKFLLGESMSKDDIHELDNYDIIVSMNNYASSSFAKVDRSRVIRVIHSLAHDRSLSSYLSLKPTFPERARLFIQRRREKSSEKRLKGVRTVCVSNYLLDRMRKFDLEEDRNLRFLPNGVDTDIFNPSRDSVAFDMLFIGRFQKMKGLDVLIEALNLLSKRARFFETRIVGDFDEAQRSYCIRLMQKEVAKKTQFLGTLPHDKLGKIISKAKFLVAPSRYESFCLPVLEAIACGKPVIASNVGGIPELVDFKVGKLVPPENPERLAKEILATTDDSQLCQGAFSEGPMKAKHYSWHLVGPTFADYLSQARTENND